MTCVLDAEQVFEVPQLMELKIWQAAYADLLVLNKVDLVDRAQVDRVRAWLDSRMHKYRLIQAVRCDVPLGLLMSAGRLGAAVAVTTGEGLGRVGPSATQALGTWSLETDQAFELDALRNAAAHLPAGIYRVKGIVQGAEVVGRPVILHVVGRRVDLSLGAAWNAGERRSRIVAIGARGAIDGGLDAFFDGCLAQTPGPGSFPERWE